MPRRDQVKITYGPARYDSPKAVRKQIEDAKQETQESTIQEITNNPELNIAGRGAISGVDVTAYDPATGEGTGIGDDGINYDFVNGTGAYLSPGDEVVLVESDDEYFVVGITQRTGQLVPVDQPIGVLDPTFPLITFDRTTTPLPLEIVGSGTGISSAATAVQSSHGWKDLIAYDLPGLYGVGSDLILGMDDGTAINAFSRDTLANLSLFPEPGSPVVYCRYVVQANGRVVAVPTTRLNTIYYRSLGDTTWSTYTLPVTPVTQTQVWAIDSTTGEVWGAYAENLTNDEWKFIRFLHTDATPQAVGTLAVTTSIATAQDAVALNAGNGFLTFMFRDSLSSSGNYKYYVKASGDSSNFTFSGTFTTSGFDPGASNVNNPAQRMAVSALGETSYLYRDAGTATLHLRLIEQGGTVYDNDTGIPVNTNNGFIVHSHCHLSSGLVAIVATVETTVFGDPTTGRYTAAFATYNYATTSYQYYDATMYQEGAFSSGVTTYYRLIPITGPIEVQTGVVRYSWGYHTGAGSSFDSDYTEVIEISGL